MTQRRTLTGFASEEAGGTFVIHIVDDSGEVFEISASRENVELMIATLQAVLEGQSGEANHARG